MTQVFNFEFKQTYREINIAGDTYKIYFDDEAMLKYQEMAIEYKAEIDSLQKESDTKEDATIEELREVQAKQIEIVKKAIELYLGEGTFEGIYEKAGRSSLALAPLMSAVMNIVQEEMESHTPASTNKYLANNKK